MKTLTTPVTNEAAATQSGWVELYDIYLKSAISTPWGTTSIIRLCTLGRTFDFFKPQIAPEATGDQGDPATYQPWPLKREILRSATRNANDRVQITGSNVTAEFAQLLADVNWYDTPVVIRKVPLISGATADDCAVIFSGLVDSAKITNQVIQLICSNDLALLNRILPSENMHTNCRFRFGDDMCSLIQFQPKNYKAGTVGSSSTTTLIKSADFDEDEGTSAGYGTDEVDALADGSITTSSENAGYTNANVSIRVSPPFGAGYHMVWLSDSTLTVDQRVQFTADVYPTGISAATWYYVVMAYTFGFIISNTLGGSPLIISTTGTNVKVTSEKSFAGNQVKSSNGGHWAFSDSADWGDVDNGYYQIPDAQAGLKNAALKPYIQFDFGSAKQLKVWRFKHRDSSQPEERVRMILIFSSTNASDWTFESYYELPNIGGGQFFDCLIPAASSARYWRICVRSRWGESLYKSLFAGVQAYTGGRHYWMDGMIEFASDTATAALRGLSRVVLESYSGEVVVPLLPAAPANGDEFVIRRGCARTFNACCARLNTDNFGGFTDLPTQTVIR